MTTERGLQLGMIQRFGNLQCTRKTALIGTTLLPFVIALGKEWALNTPTKLIGTEEVEDSFSMYPGWLEKGTAIFIDPDPLNKGHANWFRETLFANPNLVESTKQFFQYLEENRVEKRRLGLGEVMHQAFQSAEEALGNRGVALDRRTTLPLERAHAAMYIFAAGFNPWFHQEDMENLGINLHGKSVPQYYWDEEGLGTVVFPLLFGIPDTERDKAIMAQGRAPHFSGQDRTVHFAHHLMLTFVYLYSRYFGLQEHKLIPRILEKIIAIKGGSLEDQAQTFSNMVGGFYEVSGILPVVKIEGGVEVEFANSRNWPIPLVKGQDDIDEGIFDSMVGADIKANRLGAEAGIALFNKLLNSEPIDSILRELNDRKFSRLETKPVLTL